jgi:drug/metabolite transporter (DMT)-like permease
VRLNTLFIAFVAVVSLGTVHFVEKLAIEAGAPPAPFALGQTMVACLVLWPVWLWKRRRDGLTFLRSGRLGSLALIGAVASGVVVVLGIVALAYTSATHKGVVQAAYPVGTMFFAWVLLRDRITLAGYVAAGVIVLGLVLMTSRGLSGAPNIGDWMLVATVPLMGFTDAYAKKVLKDVPPVTVGLGRYLFGTVFLAVLLSVLDLGPLSALAAFWPMVLAAGVLVALSMGFFYWSMKRMGPSLAAGLLAAAPVVTAGLEWWWLEERFLAAQVLGIALVIGGVGTLARQRARVARARSRAAR